jgi:FAD:protein FMN transferase
MPWCTRFFFSVVAALQLTHADTPSPAFTFERGLMGTRFAIICHATDPSAAKLAADAAFQAAEEINQVASDYLADSELLSLTKHSAGKAIPVSPLLFHLIAQARDYAEKTEGHFDPSLGPLTKLWRESRRRNSLPEPATLSTALAASGWKNLVLDPQNSTILFAKSKMRLDLGGIAKGQAADAILRVMVAHHLPTSCITAGGDVCLGDPPPGSEGWKIGVKTTSATASEFLTLANCAVSTSGDLHQFIEINGIRYSHIIDPKTGLGITHAVSATIIAPTATMSDALATACCTAPKDCAEKMALAAGATRVILRK